MKLLVDSTLQAYATPAVFSGFVAAKHDTRFMSTYDTFDSVSPDIYIADADLLSEAVFKNIEERPALKVFVVQKNNIDTEHPYKHNILNRFGDLYPWIVDKGHADILTYRNSEFYKRYRSDIITINDQPTSDILDVSFPEDIIFRIFSSQMISHNNYCGFAIEAIRKNLYKSSKLSFSTGDDYYNSILCDCMPIQTHEDYLTAVYNDHTQKIKELKAKILSESTNFHAIISILDIAGYDKESKYITSKLKEIL